MALICIDIDNPDPGRYAALVHGCHALLSMLGLAERSQVRPDSTVDDAELAAVWDGWAKTNNWST